MDALFDKGRRGVAGPLRFVWGVADGSLADLRVSGTSGAGSVAGNLSEGGVSVLFSVPKKVFKRAWKRNLVKRRMRESYRQRKHELLAAAQAAGRQIDIALICSPAAAKGNAASTPIPDFKTIDNAVGTILAKILERS